MPVIDVDENTFSVSYSYSGCEDVSGHALDISSPGIEDGTLGYIVPTDASSDSRSYPNVVPYTNTTFQSGATYTFTVIDFTGPCCVELDPITVCAEDVST